jgi:hypothetical protein
MSSLKDGGYEACDNLTKDGRGESEEHVEYSIDNGAFLAALAVALNKSRACGDRVRVGLQKERTQSVHRGHQALLHGSLAELAEGGWGTIGCFLRSDPDPAMPFKHNTSRRHHIPMARRRITNWPAYEAGLRRRGDLTFWLDEAALSEWHAPRRTSRGGQPIYADMAIEVVLTLRLVFRLALRQVEGLTRSVLRWLGLEIAVPDHSTLSRRGSGFAGRQPRAVRHDKPVHVVLDSTGLQVFGQGEWDAEKHDTGGEFGRSARSSQRL